MALNCRTAFVFLTIRFFELSFLNAYHQSTKESRQPKVYVISGTLFGSYKKSFSNHTYEAFEGIPYAEPPVGEKRFKESILYREKWGGSWNATNPGPACLQYSHFIKLNGKYGIRGEEDCLYLNVYTRSTKSKSGKPVIVNIHGGGFSYGTGYLLGPSYLMDYEDLVYVNFNYRVGLLGFLSTGDSVVPGNMGLKDQINSLKWVQLNIKDFGGDPNKITIVGISAGGASVHYMMLSPLSEGLFHRAVSFSGTALAPWALVHDVPEKTKKLAALVGCPITSSYQMVKCLRQRPGQVLLEQIQYFQPWLYNPFTIFGPVLEDNSDAFISDHPVDIMKKGETKDIPWIISVVSEEAYYPAAEYLFDHELLKYLNLNWEKLAPYILFYKDAPENVNIAKSIKKEYLKNLGFSTTSRDEILKMLGDRLFVAPAVNTARLVSRAGNSTRSVHFYMYKQKNSIAISTFYMGIKAAVGVTHMDDTSLIFDMTLGAMKHKISDEDEEMGERLTKILIHFAKIGTVPDELNWNPVEGRKFSFLEIKNPKEIKNVDRYCKIPGNPEKIAEIFPKDESAQVGSLFSEGVLIS